MELEARAQAAAAAAGAPVPHVLVADDSVAALGNPFLICDEIKGETIVRRIQRQLDGADGNAGRSTAAAASAPRRWPPSTAPTRRRARADPRGPTRRVARAARRHGRHHRHLRVGFSLAGRPPARAVAAASGARRLPDGKPHRRRIRPGRRAGLGAGAHRRGLRRPGLVLHPGLAVRRSGRATAPAAWAASRSFLCAYEQASGTTVDRVAFHWWLVLATLRWGVICRYQAERHLSGQIPLGGAGGHRPPGLRDRVGSARPAR